MEATLTLHQAGNQLGVEDTVLSRLIRIGALPEARKIHRPGGDVWVIPADKLSSVANRNGWTIDLRDGAEQGAEAPKGEPAIADESPESVETSAVETPADTTDDKTEDKVVGNSSETTETPTVEKSGTNGAKLNGSAIVTGSDLFSKTRGPLNGALIPHTEATPIVEKSTAEDSAVEVSEVSEVTPSAPSVAEAIDLALLDRLLGVQEERVTAQVEARETRHALAALNATHDRTTGELEIERRERMVAADRYREERMARAVADAKIAELRDRVVREMSLADAEKQARSEALARSIRAEREAANAVASMGWRARRRFRRLNDSSE